MTKQSAAFLFALLLANPTHACEGGLGVSRVIDVQTLPYTNHAMHSDELGLLEGEIVLTFDDGPSRTITPQILDVLEEFCTKATFFVLGRSVSRHPELLQRVVEAGHSIGSHTYRHPRPSVIDLDLFLLDLDAGIQVTREALHMRELNLFRPPFLQWPEEVADAAEPWNLRVIGADVSGEDWGGRPCEESFGAIREGLAETRRGIILMHDIHENTVCEFYMVLEYAQAEGLRVVHLRDGKE